MNKNYYTLHAVFNISNWIKFIPFGKKMPGNDILATNVKYFTIRYTLLRRMLWYSLNKSNNILHFSIFFPST